MTVSDISEENIEWAHENVNKNKLDNRIKSNDNGLYFCKTINFRFKDPISL